MQDVSHYGSIEKGKKPFFKSFILEEMQRVKNFDNDSSTSADYATLSAKRCSSVACG